MFRRITRSGDNPPVRKPYKVQFDTFEKELDAVRPVLIDSTLPTLIVKSNLHSKDEVNKMRRRELIKEYGGNVVLLKPHEELLSTTKLDESVKNFIDYLEKSTFRRNYDGKNIVDTEEFKHLKKIISTK